jgi:hypothetical protein
MGTIQSYSPEMEWGKPFLTQGDIWSGCILLNLHAPQTIEYKYMIADWNAPNKTTA